VQRQAVVGEDNDEEDQVDTQVQHVCEQLQVKDIHALHTSQKAQKAPEILLQHSKTCTFRT